MVIDNFGLYDIEEKKMERLAEQCPVCDICGQHITCDCFYRIFDYLVCESCMEDSREYVEVL